MAVSSTPAPSQAEETVMTRVPARSHAAATAPGPHRSRAASHLVHRMTPDTTKNSPNMFG